MNNDLMSYDEFLEYCVANGYYGDIDSVRESYNDYIDANAEPVMDYNDFLEFCAMNGVQLDADQITAFQEAKVLKDHMGNFDVENAVNRRVKTKEALDNAKNFVGDKAGKAKGFAGDKFNAAKGKVGQGWQAAKKFTQDHPRISKGAAIGVGAAAALGTGAAIYNHHKKKQRAAQNEAYTYDDILEYCAENGVQLDGDQIQNLREYFF